MKTFSRKLDVSYLLERPKNRASNGFEAFSVFCHDFVHVERTRVEDVEEAWSVESNEPVSQTFFDVFAVPGEQDVILLWPLQQNNPSSHQKTNM